MGVTIHFERRLKNKASLDALARPAGAAKQTLEKANRMRTLSILVLTIALPTTGSAQWTNTVSKDEMTNEQVVYALSPHVTPSRQMDFPYADTEAWVGFMCDGKNEWLYIDFSNTPNIVNTEPTEGFSHFSTRVRWGTEVKTVQLSQKWGASVISFLDGRDALKRLTNRSADSLLLELDWYGNGTVYFKFSLEGASDAIAQARASCKK